MMYNDTLIISTNEIWRIVYYITVMINCYILEEQFLY